MHWIIQQNLHEEKQFKALTYAIKTHAKATLGIVKNMFDGDFEREPFVPSLRNAFCIGTTSMQKAADKRGWLPGYIQVPDIGEMLRQWGPLCLNYGAWIGNLDAYRPTLDSRFHVRPLDDSKSFAGTVMTDDEYLDWVDKVRAMDGNSTLGEFTVDTTIVVSPLKHIEAEFRVIIVGGRVITGSMYQPRKAKVDDHTQVILKNFIAQALSQWIPAAAFVIDIAFDEMSIPKIIEIGSVSGAGLYESDMFAFVKAMEIFYDPRIY